MRTQSSGEPNRQAWAAASPTRQSSTMITARGRSCEYLLVRVDHLAVAIAADHAHLQLRIAWGVRASARFYP